MAEFNFKFSDASYEAESNGQKIKMPLIRVECDNEDFYKTVEWQNGKNPFANGQKCFYANGYCDICDDNGNVVTTTSQNNENQHDLYVLRDLNNALLDAGYRIFNDGSINKINFVSGGQDKLVFQFQDTLNQNKKRNIYMWKNGIITNENSNRFEQSADYPYFLYLARKNKADFVTFRYIAKEKKFMAPDKTAVYHFVKENLNNQEPEEHIYIDSKGYEVDQNGKRKLINNQPYLVWNKSGYENFLSLVRMNLDLNQDLWCLHPSFIYGKAKLCYVNENPEYKFYLKTNQCTTSSGKNGFFMWIDFRDYDNPGKKYFFIDEKDGKIYDQTGEHLKKIDFVKREIVDADENTCSNITDRDLYAIRNYLFDSYHHEIKNEYDISKPKKIIYFSVKKQAEDEVETIEVTNKVFGQPIDNFLVSLKKSRLGATYFGEVLTKTKISDEKNGLSSYMKITDEGRENLFDAIKQKGYFNTEFVIHEGAKFSKIKDENGDELDLLPVTFKVYKSQNDKEIVNETKFFVDRMGFIYLEAEKEKIAEFGHFDLLGNKVYDDHDSLVNIYRDEQEYLPELIKTLNSKGFFCHEKLEFDVDPVLKESELKFKNGDGKVASLEYYEIKVKVDNKIIQPDVKFCAFPGDTRLYKIENDELDFAHLCPSGYVIAKGENERVQEVQQNKALLEALNDKGLFLENEKDYHVDPDEMEIEVDKDGDGKNKNKVKIKCRRVLYRILSDAEEKYSIEYFVDVDSGDVYFQEDNKYHLYEHAGLDDNFLKANGIKVKDKKPDNIKSVNKQGKTIDFGFNKITGYEFSDMFLDKKILDKKSGRIYSCDDGFRWSDGSPDFYKYFESQGIFKFEFEILDEEIVNNHKGHRVKIKVRDMIDNTVTIKRTVFIEIPGGNIYDETAQTREKINIIGELDKGKGFYDSDFYASNNVNARGLFYLKKTLLEKNIDINNEKDFVGLEKYNNDNKSFNLKIKDPNNKNRNKEIRCYVDDKDGSLKKFNNTIDAVSIGDIELNGNFGFGLHEENKFLPAIRRHLKESEIKNIFDGYMGREFEKQSWYTQPNQVFKEISFPDEKDGTKQYKNFILKVIVGPANNKNLQEEKEIKGFIDDDDGYVKNEAGEFIDINGLVLRAGAPASLQPEIKKVMGTEGIKKLSGYTEPNKRLLYEIKKIPGVKDLLEAKIILEPEKKDVNFYISDDGFVYKEKEKQTKMKLIINASSKTAELKNLGDGEEFNLLLKSEDKNYFWLINKIKSEWPNFGRGRVFEIVEDEKYKSKDKNEPKIFGFKDRKGRVYYIDRTTHFIVNEEGNFIDKNNQPINFDKDDKNALKKVRNCNDELGKLRFSSFKNKQDMIVKNPFLEKPITVRVKDAVKYFNKLDDKDYGKVSLIELKNKLVDAIGEDGLNKFLDKFNELKKEFEANKEKSECKNLAEYIQKKFSVNPVIKCLSITLGGAGGVSAGAFAAILVLGLVTPLPMIIGLATSGVSFLAGIGTGLGTYLYKRSERNKLEEVEYTKNENRKEKKLKANIFSMIKESGEKPKETKEVKDGDEI